MDMNAEGMMSMIEKWRQKLHIEPPQGWLNDPNGLCFYKEKYHVFFQYAPDSPEGRSKKCWGHYESCDLLKWEFVGTALLPDSSDDRDGVYSGSAMIADYKMEIFYTGNVKETGDYDYVKSGRGANVIRVSSNNGRDFSAKKVVLRNSDYPQFCSCHVRDPKLWEEDGKYFMVLGVRTLSDEGCVIIFRSEDLDHWEYVKKLSVPDFGYMWECPDLFRLQGKEFLSISPQGLGHEETRFQNVYSSGYFLKDGDRLSDYDEWDLGFDFYAPQSFEAPDGRRILIGWFGIGDSGYANPTTELGWQHCLTLPRELTLAEDGKILQNPIRELQELRGEKLSDVKSIPLPFELCGNVIGSFEIEIAGGLILKYDGKIFKMQFTDERLGGGRTVRNAEVADCSDIRIIADMSSLEIYLDGGRKVLGTRFYPETPFADINMRGISADIYTLDFCAAKL